MLIYRIIMALALPIVLLVLTVRRSRHIGERLGFGLPAPPGETIWMHAASNGEMTSARWVLQAVLDGDRAVQVLVTCNTQTARAMVLAWRLPRVTVALAPLDAGGAALRVLRRWRPRALVIVENELWPERIAAAHAHGIPVLVIGARMSQRSARNWRKLRRLMAQTLTRVAWVSAQDAGSRDRLQALGLPARAVGPIVALKAFGPATVLPAPFAAPALRSRTVLAASTHDGDEALILDAFIAARAANRFDHLILAPRHPRRAAQIAAMIAARSLRFATRSNGEVPDADTPVYLADTMGEMDHWYAMAGVTIIGGSFSDKGGHTPWEPANHASAIVHGPDVANFVAPFKALESTGGAIAVSDGDDLVRILMGMDADKQALMAAAAKVALTPQTAANLLVDKILACLARP